MKLVLPTHAIKAEDGFTKYKPLGVYLKSQKLHLDNVLKDARLIDDNDIEPSSFQRVMAFVVFMNREGHIHLLRQDKGICHVGLGWFIDKKEPDQLLLHEKGLPFIGKDEADFYFEGTVRDLVNRSKDIAFVFSVETEDVKLGDSLKGEWLSITDAAKHYGQCDAFSKLILDYFYEASASDVPETTQL